MILSLSPSRRQGTVRVRIRVRGPDLQGQRQRLLDYCKRGGRIVCFYHKPSEWNVRPGHPLLAPYPLVVGHSRVCEEDARVTPLQPTHRLWNHPNRLGKADFDGWVQERGLNFPSQWDEHWQPMLRMADAGEKPKDGALLYCDYGGGQFLYCSLALYRQLRVGHAGAARILANLLSPAG